MSNTLDDLTRVGKHPYIVMLDYSMPSGVLFGTYFFSKLISMLLHPPLLRHGIHIDPKFKSSSKDTSRRGWFFFQIFIIAIGFSIDYSSECDKLKIGSALEEFAIAVLPIYMFMFLMQRILPYNKEDPHIISVLVWNLLEGIPLFILYNWMMNFRKRFGYVRCGDKKISADVKTVGKKQNSFVFTETKGEEKNLTPSPPAVTYVKESDIFHITAETKPKHDGAKSKLIDKITQAVGESGKIKTLVKGTVVEAKNKDDKKKKQKKSKVALIVITGVLVVFVILVGAGIHGAMRLKKRIKAKAENNENVSDTTDATRHSSS